MRAALIIGILVSVSAPAVAGSAGPAYLVRDINMVATGSGAVALGVGPGVLLFSGTDAVRGFEPWKSDGSDAGTVLVRDIVANGDSFPGQFVAAGEITFFQAQQAEHGREHWRTDGTAGGTALLKDIRPGPVTSTVSADPNIGRLAAFVSEMFLFTADDGEHGAELWKSDGSEAGTVLVKDLNPGPGASTPSGFTAIDPGVVLFAAELSLWRTDGTEPGTVRIATFTPSPFGNRPLPLVALDGALLFATLTGEVVANPTAHLWRSDGTENGTEEIASFSGAISALGLAGSAAVAGGAVLFSAAAGPSMQALWRTDGTAEGTEIVRMFGRAPSRLTTFGDTVFFIAEDTPSEGLELWKSDGTADGTSLVLDILPGAGSSNPANLTAFDGNLYFTANDGSGTKLFRSDGSAGGTLPIGPQAFMLAPVGDILFFTANTPMSSTELWRTDGTAAGTAQVKDVFPGTADSSPSAFAAFDDALVFVANDGVNGTELWRSDSSEGGTQRFSQIGPADLSAFAGLLTPLGDRIFLRASRSDTGSEPWISDGTEAGTQLLKDLVPEVGQSSTPNNFIAVGDRVLFTATVPGSGEEPYVSDGTEAGTNLVKDVRPGAASSIVATVNYRSRFAALGSVLYFTADDGVHGIELFRSDGSEQGTSLVIDLPHRVAGFGPLGLTPLDDVLLFTADVETQPIVGEELWRTDGTEAGTVRFTGAGAGPFSPRDLERVGDVVYYTGIGGNAGAEIWRTDGTAGGTFQVKDINPGPANAFSISTAGFTAAFTAVGAEVFFTAEDGSTGFELWKTDGTEEGTTLVRDIMPGVGSSSPRELVRVDNLLAFIADDGVSGQEIWISDGTTDGTQLAADLVPGRANAGAAGLFGFGPPGRGTGGGRLYFTATVPLYGRELWALPVGVPPPPTATATRTPTVVPSMTGTAGATGTPTATVSTTSPGGATATPTPSEGTVTAAPTTPSSSGTPTAPSTCLGDCNGNRMVAINELIVGVNIALGAARLEQCVAFDADTSGTVAVNELVRGVGNALGGCA